MSDLQTLSAEANHAPVASAPPAARHPVISLWVEVALLSLLAIMAMLLIENRWLLGLALVAVVLLTAWCVDRRAASRMPTAAGGRDRESALSAELIEAQKLAKCGSWEMTLEPYRFVASQAYLDIYQMTPDNCPRSSREWIERFVRDPAAIAHAEADEALAAAGIEASGVRQVTLDDGSQKWIEYRKTPRKDAAGKVIGFRGIARDITAEHAVIDRLVEQTAELERARKLAGFGTWHWDIATDCLRSSDRMREIYRTTSENYPPTFREWCERFIPAEDSDAFWPLYDSKFGGKPFDRERRIIDAEGGAKWIRTIAEPVFGVNGDLVAYDGVTMDITAQKRVMIELARQTAMLVEAQQVAHMGSWYWDVMNGQLDVSAEYRQLYGLSAVDPVPTTMEEWIGTYCHPDEVAIARSNIARVLNGDRLDLHRRIVLPSTGVRWVHVIAHPVRDAAGRVIGCTGVTRDVTLEKERELALVERTQQLNEAHRIGQMGHFYWNLVTDELQILNDHAHIFGDGESAPFRTMREWEQLFCHPDDRAKSAETQNVQVNAGLPYIVERRTITPEGDVRWLESRAEPVFDGNGVAIAYRGAFRNITMQKVAELRLKESEEKYRLISENMHDVVALYAADGTILYCSPSSAGVLGFPAEGTFGKSPFHSVHPDDIEWVRGVVADIQSGRAKTSNTLEYRFRHADGRYLWLETVVAPVRNSDGSVKHYQASTRDVTERHQAADRVRRSEARFRALTEISADWYWETDAEHRLSFLSIDRTVHSHKDRKDLLGRTRWEIFPKALSDEEWQLHRQKLAAQQPFQGLVMRVFDQTDTQPIGYLSLNGRPFFDVTGVFLGYRGVGRDITRIKLAERQLAENEERYRLITQHMRDLISLHSVDGRLTFVSPSFTVITGHAMNRIVGRRPMHLFHRADLRRVNQCFAALIEGRTAPTIITYRLRHRDGHYLWLESQVALVRAADGSLSHAQVASRDVTARHEAELAVARKTEELGSANRQLEIEVHRRQELERNILMTIEMELAQVGLELHDELGQDLTGVALLTKSLERKLAERGLDGTADAARISELVNRTIRHTRMISHGLSPYIWGMDGLVSALRQLASDINSLGVVECETQLDRNIEIHDDLVARSLYRIAQESINNALKHSHAQRITLSLSQLKNGVELMISDNGTRGNADRSVSDPLEAGSRFHSIRHRCSAIDAALSIKRGRQGGATVRVTWHRTLVQSAAQRALPTQEAL